MYSSPTAATPGAPVETRFVKCLAIHPMKDPVADPLSLATGHPGPPEAILLYRLGQLAPQLRTLSVLEQIL
jgi:hypothetical protein